MKTPPAQKASPPRPTHGSNTTAPAVESAMWSLTRTSDSPAAQDACVRREVPLLAVPTQGLRDSVRKRRRRTEVEQAPGLRDVVDAAVRQELESTTCQRSKPLQTRWQQVTKSRQRSGGAKGDVCQRDVGAPSGG